MDNKTLVAIVALVTAACNVVFILSGASHSLSCTIVRASTQVASVVHAAAIEPILDGM